MRTARIAGWGAALPDKIVTNGPLKMTKWDHNKSLEFVKNDGYWNAKNISLTKIVAVILPGWIV